MAPIPISLGVRSNPQRDSAAGYARLINCYAEDAGDEGKVRLPLWAADGFEAWSTLSGSGVGVPRAALPLSETVLYVVAGTRVIKLDTSGTPTLITGTVASSGLVTMARNRKSPDAQIGISAGGSFYILEDDTLTEISLTSLDSGTLTSIAAVDGYFILLFDNGEFFITSIDEGTTIDDLDFAVANANPDGGSRVMVIGREVLLFGPQSLEPWQNTGAEDFPFERITSRSFGCWAAASAVNVEFAREGAQTVDTVVFAASGAQGEFIGVHMIADSYSSVKISHHAVDRAVQAATKANLKGFSWSRAGHTFYAITDGSTFTWVYDFATGLWHERKSSALDFWRITLAVSFADKNIVGDYTLSKLYWMKSGLFHASNAVTIKLEHSNDHGDTFFTSRTKSVGGAAQRKTRVRFNRLGQSKEDGKVLRLTQANAVIEDGTGVDMVVQPPTVHAYPNPMRFGALWVDTIPGTSLNAREKGIIGLTVDAVQLVG